MPIRPELRHLYRGPAWRATRERILARAGNACEECGAPNHKTVLGCMQWWTPISMEVMAFMQSSLTKTVDLPWRCKADQEPQMLGFPRMPHMRYRGVQLGIAHLNHDPVDNRDENLKALCRRCHLVNDKYHHRETRSARKDAARPILRAAAEGEARA